MLDDVFARLAQLAIPTLLRRQIHNDRPRLHPPDHVLCHQHRCRLPGNQGRGDDNICGFDVLADQLDLFLMALGRLFFGVAPHVLGLFLDDVKLDELRAQTFHLLFDNRANVEHLNHCSQPLRRGNGL